MYEVKSKQPSYSGQQKLGSDIPLRLTQSMKVDAGSW